MGMYGEHACRGYSHLFLHLSTAKETYCRYSCIYTTCCIVNHQASCHACTWRQSLHVNVIPMSLFSAHLRANTWVHWLLCFAGGRERRGGRDRGTEGGRPQFTDISFSGPIINIWKTTPIAGEGMQLWYSMCRWRNTGASGTASCMACGGLLIVTTKMSLATHGR